MNEKQFGIIPTKTLFFRLAIPGLFSMVFQSISMIVDGIFVGQFIGNDALAAINMAMPVLMIIFAFSDMIAIGFSVKIAIQLGAKKEKLANGLFSASFLLILGSSVVFGILGILLTEPIVNSTITDKELGKLIVEYANVYFYLLPISAPLFAVDNYLRICGRIKHCMFINIGVALLNIILDAVLLGKLGLGIEWAAFATAFSMGLGAIVATIPFLRKKLTLKFTSPKVSFKEFKGAIFNGSSEFFSIIADSLMMLLLNGILLKVGGSAAVAAYAIAMYFHSILFAILYGIQDSLQPAVSYNYGAQKIPRCFSLFKITCLAALSICSLFALILFIFPEVLVSAFTDTTDPDVLYMAKMALILGAPGYFFAWINMVTSCFLTGFDKPKESVTIMLGEAFIFPITSLLILTPLMGINGIFLTPSLGSALAAVVAVILWVKTSRKVKKSK